MALQFREIEGMWRTDRQTDNPRTRTWPHNKQSRL